MNLLLFCLWAGRCNHRLTAAELSALAQVAGPWHDAVVRPLRAVRRWLKVQAAAEALRQEVKRIELESERLEQDLLHARLPLSEAADDPDADAGAGSGAARANLLAYLTEPEPPELQSLVEAAFD